MGASGTTTINFGAYPGATDVTVAVTGQTSILSGSLAEAWIFPAVTADHTVDEHWVDPPVVMAGNVSAGVGFTIYGKVREQTDGSDDINGYAGIGKMLNNSGNTAVYGVWNVAWVWN